MPSDLATVDPLDCDPRDHEDRDAPDLVVYFVACPVCRECVDVGIELPDGTLVHDECAPSLYLEDTDGWP